MVLRNSMIVLGMLTVAGCANNGVSVGGAQCSAMDWRALGAEDGSKGIGTDNLAARSQSCGSGTADGSAYMQGHAQGLAQYCTVERGYSEGRAGRPYTGACPVQLAAAFQQGYTQGTSERLAAAPSAPRWDQNVSIGVGIRSGGKTSVGISLGTVLGL